MKRIWIWVLAVGYGLAISALGVGGWYWWSSQQAYRELQDQIHDCQDFVREIQTLRQRPSQAVVRPVSTATVTQQLENAVRVIGLSADCLRSIEPQAAARIENSTYKLQTIRVTLSPLSISQSSQVFQALLTEEPALTISHLSYQSPSFSNDLSDRELWQVEITLTYRIYDPKVQSPL